MVRLLDGLGQRYGQLPSEMMERGIVQLMFDAECAVMGSEAEQREIDEIRSGRGWPGGERARETRRRLDRETLGRFIDQLPEDSAWRRKLEEQSRGG